MFSTFFCDWGSSDSNWLLFFQAVSFLLGALAAWYYVGAKPKTSAADNTLRDVQQNLEATLEQKNLELAKWRLQSEDAKARVQRLEEEKGFLRAELYQARNGEN